MSALLRFSAAAQRLFAATQPADEGKWSVLFPRGEYHGPNLAGLGGSVNLTDDVFKDMIASWEDQGKPDLPVYWHHVNDLDRDAIPPDKLAEVFRQAGHIEDFRITAAGLEARTTWSAEGRAAVESDAYRHWSAEWQRGYQDRRTGEIVRRWCVTGAALTDTPFFNEMPRVAASSTPTQGGEEPQEQSTMNKKRIIAALALKGITCSETDSDETVMAAVEKMCATATATASAADIEARITAAVAPVEKLLASAQAALSEEKARASAATEKLAKFEASAKAKELDTFMASLTGFGAKSREHIKEYAEAFGLEKAKAFASTLKPTKEPGETGVNVDPTADQVDTVALKKSFDAELDAETTKLVASGATASVALQRATASVSANPKYAPLFPKN